MWNDKFVNEFELPMGALWRSMTNVKQRVVVTAVGIRNKQTRIFDPAGINLDLSGLLISLCLCE